MASKKKLKTSHFNTEINKCGFHLMDLPTELLTHLLATYLSLNKLNNFGLVNKKCQEIHQVALKMRLTKCVDLRKLFYLDEKKALERVRDLNYKSVNLNQCYYLSPSFITELISKDSVRELDLTECNCTPQVIEAVAKLNLTSLNISLSKSWKNFFVINKNKSVAVLNGLTKLEICHRFRSAFWMSHVAQYVLPHCSQLLRLKLVTPYSLLREEETIETVVQNNQKCIPTPVPNLQSLVFDNCEDHLEDIKTFLEVILREKKIPLTNIDLGNATITALLSEIFPHQKTQFENTDILRLDCYSVYNPSHPNRKELDVERVIKSTPTCTKYIKKVFVEDFYIPKCSRFTDIFVNYSDNATIQEISLNRCEVQDGICYFIDTIFNLSPGITHLDLSLVKWSRTLSRNRLLSNSDLMNSLANLTNLRTLCIVPVMLSHIFAKDKELLTSSFSKLTEMCKSLRNLRIVGHNNYAYIRQDVLSCIKFLKNLKELYLANFSTDGTEQSALPEITEHCSKLKRLYIRFVFKENRFDKMLLHAKQIKYLFLKQPFKLTKSFVDNLSQCTQLKKLYISLSNRQDKEMHKYFAQSLIKLNKLQFLSTTDTQIVIDDYFRSAYEEIKETRPRFYFDNLEPHPVPMAHHQFLRY